jgi:hypothetical protein
MNDAQPRLFEKEYLSDRLSQAGSGVRDGDLDRVRAADWPLP